MKDFLLALDWSPMFQALLGLLAAAVPILGGKVFVLLGELTKESRMDRLGNAAERAAGQVVDAVGNAAVTAAPAALSTIKEAAIQAASDTMAATMAETISKLGGTPDQIEAMVRGELGRMTAAVHGAPVKIAAPLAKPAGSATVMPGAPQPSIP
jgi:class 3 adenylate cyclase